MNYFDAQDNARRATKWLVVVYIIATILIVAGVTGVVAFALGGTGQFGLRNNPSALLAIAGVVLAVIIGATLYKTARLSSGGGRVAVDLGATLVPENESDPLRRRLRNVVEEMAIASGVPVPEIYVMEQESGINAFAAGFTPADAAVAVTRGTLELLDRDELQGVIAHEFSHILNGDMRLNIRMMGVLFGIMVVGVIGRTVLRGSYHGGMSLRRSSRHSGGSLALGLGLSVLGWIGVFLARLVKAAVSRQREFLADASAVQFTRQTDGIGNALRKIGGYQAHSYFQASDPEEVSHMLFAVGAKFSSLFATHPPLADRIRAIDPQFDESQYPEVNLVARQASTTDSAEHRSAGFAATLNQVATAPASLAATVGQPGHEHIQFAHNLRLSIPENVANAAHSPSNAYLMTLALFVDPSAEPAGRQTDFLQQQLGQERGQLIRNYHAAIGNMGEQFRLPLLEIAFPALKRMPAKRLEFLLDLAQRLIEMDGKIDFHEFCIYRVLKSGLLQAASPSARHRKRRSASRADVRNAAVQVVSLLADRGHNSEEDKKRAFKAGLSEFGEWSANTPFEPVATDAVGEFDRSLDVLRRMNSAAIQSLLEAINVTVAHDGKVSVKEAEMIRAICASLDCPLPPIITA